MKSMDFQSAMETFAEAWVAANAKTAVLDAPSHQSQALSLTCPKTPPSPVSERSSVVNKPDVNQMYSKDQMIDGKVGIDKSLPVHCIVETILSLEEQNDREKNNWRKKSNVEIDSYVIIPVNTPIQELVLVALTRLGYPKEVAAAAKGAVLIRNWRALSFDTISPGPMVTVGELFGELSTIATLRIQILRPKASLVQDMKDKLLRLLLVQSHNLLLRSGCPLDTPVNMKCIPADDIWIGYTIKDSNLLSGMQTKDPLQSEERAMMTLSNLCRENISSQSVIPNEEIRSKFEVWVSSQLNNPNFHVMSPTLHNAVSQRLSNSPKKESDIQQSMLQNQLTQKTRMRTSFDPELELPKLQKWFLENQHPSRQQIQQYVKELNGLESRRGRKPLDINNVVYWFKNARAAQKRAELRGFCTPLLNMNVNGFHGFHSPIRTQPPSLISSDQHSVSEDETSRLSDDNDNTRAIDINDNDADVPLSLTTANNQRNSSEYYGREERITSNTEPLKENSESETVASLGNRGSQDSQKTSSPVRDSGNTLQKSDHHEGDLSREASITKICPTLVPDRSHGTTVETNDAVNNSIMHSHSHSNENDTNNISCNSINNNVNNNNNNNNNNTNVNSNNNNINNNNNNNNLINNNNNNNNSNNNNMNNNNNNNMNGNNINNNNNMSTMNNNNNNMNGNNNNNSNNNNNNNNTEENFSEDEEPNDDERSNPRARKDCPDDGRSQSPTGNVLMSRLPPGFPLVPNSMFSHSIMYMSHYMPGLSPIGPGRDQSMLALSQDERRKRNRTFIDPVTEVPRLEQWFSLNTHPSHNLILKYTDELNRMPYRQKFPRLEPKNVQFWFKNRRAKCKRLKMSLFDNQGSHYQPN